ncbi:MAG TPA: PD-(D/E)XK nuclease domain-containing protein, partial [Thermotogota bacterium]|nr:PD-(D/E)XK nuclease domain-containing protein [Thermotogota bacterium]
RFTLDTLSYYDLALETENAFHMLLLGMLAQLQEQYTIRSNRESGSGRYDILLKPKDRGGTGVVIEVKARKQDLEEALEQIESKGYERELRAEGIEKVLKLAIGVDGKNVEVRIR